MTTKECKSFIVEKLMVVDSITCRPMMGEYLLYCQSKLFGGIYDNRMLVKKTSENQKYNLQEVIPYKGAKPMYYVENLEVQDMLKEIVIITCESLPDKK